jgi:hypothetical protein
VVTTSGIENSAAFAVKIGEVLSAFVHWLVPARFFKELESEKRYFHVQVLISDHQLIPKPQFLKM